MPPLPGPMAGGVQGSLQGCPATPTPLFTLASLPLGSQHQDTGCSSRLLLVHFHHGCFTDFVSTYNLLPAPLATRELYAPFKDEKLGDAEMGSFPSTGSERWSLIWGPLLFPLWVLPNDRLLCHFIIQGRWDLMSS